MWFQNLTGINESRVSDIADQFVVEEHHIISKVNGRRMQHGTFETPTLSELRQRRSALPATGGLLRVRELVGDVGGFHRDKANAGAMYQVASQFNTLEMLSPSVTPEDGIENYENDGTQGPACAIACGAGTIYRNYLVPLEGRLGQSEQRQINCLDDLAAALDTDIPVRNGYALPSRAQLDRMNLRLSTLSASDRETLMGNLRIGVMWDTEVTLEGVGHTVSQAYCSAAPVSYSGQQPDVWEPLARLILDAAYEATFAVAVLNARQTGNNTLFLTSLGGGAFGNPRHWISAARQRALELFAHADLDVVTISYG
jgi:hypothetical protein